MGRLEPGRHQRSISECRGGGTPGSHGSQAQTEVGIQPGQGDDGAFATGDGGRPPVRRDANGGGICAGCRKRMYPLGISGSHRDPVGRDLRRCRRDPRHIFRRYGSPPVCSQRRNRQIDLERAAGGSVRRDGHGHAPLLQGRAIPAVLLVRGSAGRRPEVSVL